MFLYILANLDAKALTYCNPTYAYGGVCNSSSAWATDAIDFEVITGSTLSYDSCLQSSKDASCGYGNNLIDNDLDYWFATPVDASPSRHVFQWYPDDRSVDFITSDYLFGVRPILRLESTVQLVGESGTYTDPYQISP